MEGKRGPSGEHGEGEPGASTDAAGGAREEASVTPVERFGPLELTRLRKDDGRSLIVYKRVERET
jgi:hypothetical protein